jgi:hypothetical protein
MQRWWDGAAWTAFTRPTPTAAPADVPTQRSTSPRTDAAPADPADQLEKADEALAALHQQGGLLGAFATVASQALHSQLPPTAPTGPGLEPYGRPTFGGPLASGGDDRDRTSVSWSIGPFSGGSDPDRYDGRRRRGTTTGPVGELVFGLVFLLVGLLAATWMASDNSTHGDESTATGTVVDHEIRVDSDGDQMCSPIASFTVGGTTYTAGSHVSTNHCPDLGSSVTVIYTTAAPGDGDARVKDTTMFRWLVWLFPTVGLVFVVHAVRRLGVVGRAVRAVLPRRS